MFTKYLQVTSWNPLHHTTRTSLLRQLVFHRLRVSASWIITQCGECLMWAAQREGRTAASLSHGSLNQRGAPGEGLLCGCVGLAPAPTPSSQDHWLCVVVRASVFTTWAAVAFWAYSILFCFTPLHSQHMWLYLHVIKYLLFWYVYFHISFIWLFLVYVLQRPVSYIVTSLSFKC